MPTFTGTAGADTLVGDSETDDLLLGLGGNDVLDGREGNDTTDGGPGHDWHYIDSHTDVVVERDGEGYDTVVTTSLSYILTETMFVEELRGARDAYGNSRDNVLVGTDNADTLRGGGGADTLIGWYGDDTLRGDAGADVMDGGLGQDTYYIDDSGDQIVEAPGTSEQDTARVTVSYTLAAGLSIERLVADAFVSAPLTLIGNEFNQTLQGGSGDDVLDGRGGADYLYDASGGNDTFYVDNPGDKVVASGGGVDTVLTTISFTAGVAILRTTNEAGTEAIDLTGGGAAQSLYGNAGANQLSGAGGDDTLFGLAGNDRLIGGAGTDQLHGGAGDDFIYVNSLTDVVFEAAGEGSDRVLAGANFTLTAGVHVEILTTDDNLATFSYQLNGNELSQYVYGNAGNNTLDGRGGADVLVGLGGDDWLFVDTIGDRVVEAAGGGSDRVLASASYTLGSGSFVEKITTSNNLATTAIDLTGNEIAQYIYGNAGSNVVDGKGGADNLLGLDGADTFAFTTALGGGNVDSIRDFEQGLDRIALDDAVFTGLTPGSLPAAAFVIGPAAQDANDRIIYDSTSGALYFDADGAGGAAAVQFASISGLPALSAADFVVV